MQKLKRPAIIGFFIFLTIAAVLHFLDMVAGVDIPALFLTISRMIAILFLLFFAITRKSLTTYILVSMVVGAEVGHDFPAFAVNLNLLSKIFLNMIKTIIAPLLFGTLVVGIAGHPDLKQVGRMGWKSIVYFEVVSTIALFIGLAAINISGAGLGVNMPVDPATANLPVIQKQTWQEIILHIFPENIAKSIFEGNVLQIVVFSILFGIACFDGERKVPQAHGEFCRVAFGGDVQIHQPHHVLCTDSSICSDRIQRRTYGVVDPCEPLQDAGHALCSPDRIYPGSLFPDHADL